MNIFMRIFAASLLFIASFPSTCGDYSSAGNEKEKKHAANVNSALSKSIEKMLAIGIRISDKSIFISKQKEFIVVSFLPSNSQALGGRMHHVYDPQSDSIIYVLGQD